MTRNLRTGAAFAGLLITLGIASTFVDRKAAVEAATVQAPIFEVDPMWPKPLPNHWVIGKTIGVSVDAQDNVWIIHRGGSLEAKEKYADTNPPGAECCVPAPPVLEFDKAGNLIGHWGGRTAPDMTGRTPITESQWTTRATCGSAAMAAPTAVGPEEAVRCPAACHGCSASPEASQAGAPVARRTITTAWS